MRSFPHRRSFAAGETAKFARGFSLVETLIAVSVMGVIGTGIVTIVSNLTKNQRMMEIIGARDGLSARLSQIALSTTSILSSANNKTSPGNQILSNCLSGLGCPAGTPDRQTPFDLWEGSSVGAPVRVAGTPTNPVRYGTKGEANCNPSLNQFCLFQAVAFFWVSCGGGATACVEAQTIHVRQQIRVIPNDLAGGRVIQNSPPDSEFIGNGTMLSPQSPSHSSPILVDDINSLKPGFCGNGAMLTKYDSKSTTTLDSGKGAKLICVCPPNTIQISNAPVTCALPAAFTTCTEPAVVMVGMNAIGGPVCVRRNDNVTCRNINVTRGGNCGRYQWLQSVRIGECHATDGGKGNAPNFVCSPSIGRCCKLP